MSRTTKLLLSLGVVVALGVAFAPGARADHRHRPRRGHHHGHHAYRPAPHYDYYHRDVYHGGHVDHYEAYRPYYVPHHYSGYYVPGGYYPVPYYGSGIGFGIHGRHFSLHFGH